MKASKELSLSLLERTEKRILKVHKEENLNKKCAGIYCHAKASFWLRTKGRKTATQRDDQAKEFSYLGIWICQEICLDSLEQACSLFAIHILDLIFVDLSITLDVICAGSLADGSSFRSGYKFVLVSDLLNCILPDISFNQAKAVG
jgi:hypothetical protein